ncbi:restriction endonuclease subunit S [Kluyvera intermedia]|uniref:restriction endonuclease subunit S n=1 Tax=Kluyvera intermedia TaxID=61648 RepID=UPI00372D6B93
MVFEGSVPNGWKLVKLSDLGEVNRGKSKHRPRDAAFLYGGSYPFIQTGDVKASDGRITSYNQTYSEAGLKQSRLWPSETMCITIAANIAETGILTFPACFPDSIIGFIADKKQCDVFFIEYLFRLLKRRIQAQANGSVQDNINLQTLERIIFPVPEIRIQKNISNFLKKLDDKIILNKEINQTLEQMSQTLFKSWFVDFDPVIDNALDAGNSIPEALQSRAELRQKVRNSADFKPLPANIRTLFPAEFEETELGWVPKGWDIVKTEDIALKIGMGPFGSNIKVSTFVDSGVPVISGQHLKEILIIDGGNNFITLEHAEKLKNSAVYRKDIIFTHAGNIGQVSIIPDDSEYDDYIISQRQFYLRVNESKSSPYYLIHYFRSEQGQHALLSNASQVGVPSIARPSTHLRNITFLNPSKPLLEEFDKLCDPLFKRFNQNRKCSISLTDLRDTLLPKLISGELSLEDLPNLANQTEPA